MKRTLLLIMALALPSFAAVNLRVPVTDFSLNPRPGVVVSLQRLPPAGVAAGSFVSAGPVTRRTDTTGSAWFTNVVAGTYKITISDPEPRAYQIVVSTNAVGTTNALNLVTIWPSALP